MDTPTLVGTGFVVLGARRLDRLRRLRLPERAASSAAARWLWTILVHHLRAARADAAVRPAEERAGHAAGSSHVARTKKSEQEALYEVPKKHH